MFIIKPILVLFIWEILKFVQLVVFNKMCHNNRKPHLLFKPINKQQQLIIKTKLSWLPQLVPEPRVLTVQICVQANIFP